MDFTDILGSGNWEVQAVWGGVVAQISLAVQLLKTSYNTRCGWGKASSVYIQFSLLSPAYYHEIMTVPIISSPCSFKLFHGIFIVL